MLIKKSLWNDSRGAATIIILVCAIVISIAASYLMVGLSLSFTRYEKLEFVSAYAFLQNGFFVITIEVKNTGSETISLDEVFLNGKSINEYGNVVETNLSGTIKSGQQLSGTIILMNGENWRPGMSVEVMICTKSGVYPKTVTLPY